MTTTTKEQSKMSLHMVALADVLSNPYRKTARYHISEDKVEALLSSFKNSGFWDGSIQGRPSPTKKGKVEIAYGHHRLEAAKRAKITEIGIVVGERSNAVMLKMMADENRAEFKHDAGVSVETIRAVVEAYSSGEIDLEAVDAQYGRKGAYDLPGGKSYSLATIARFLGWVKPSDGQATSACRIAFDAYLSEASTKAAMDSLKPSERSEAATDMITVAARSARVHAERANLKPAQIQKAERVAAMSAADTIREDSAFRARSDAVSIGAAAVREVAPKAKTQPPVEIYIAKLIDRWQWAHPAHEVLTDCRRLVPFIDDLQPAQARKLADVIETTYTRALTEVQRMAKTLRSGNIPRIKALLEESPEK